MIAVSDIYKTELANDNRNFYVKGDIKFWNGETLTVDNETIWQDGFRITQAVSGQSAFEIGACVINQLTLVLNNIYGDFDGYDFGGATITASFGLYASDGTLIDMDGNGATTIQKGVYFVDEVDTNGSLITLTCLDAMAKFDTDFSAVSITYPATLQTIVQAICAHCGVTYTQGSFLNSSWLVNVDPADLTSMTCRDVLSDVCEIACCYATIDRTGSLIIWFYNDAFTRRYEAVDGDLDGGSFWADVDSADGGSFWSDDDTHDAGSFEEKSDPDFSLSSFYNFTRSERDVEISGVKVVYNSESYFYGSDKYAIEVTDNVFVISELTASAAAVLIGQLANGIRFRPYSVDTLLDPTMEAGDTVEFTDLRGVTYQSLITETEFAAGNKQRVECNAESEGRQSSTRYSAAAKAARSAEVTVTSYVTEYTYDLLSSEFTTLENGVVVTYRVAIKAATSLTDTTLSVTRNGEEYFSILGNGVIKTFNGLITANGVGFYCGSEGNGYETQVGNIWVPYDSSRYLFLQSYYGLALVAPTTGNVKVFPSLLIDNYDRTNGNLLFPIETIYPQASFQYHYENETGTDEFIKDVSVGVFPDGASGIRYTLRNIIPPVSSDTFYLGYYDGENVIWNGYSVENSFQSEDAFSVDSEAVSGFITGSSKQLQFFIPTSRKVLSDSCSCESLAVTVYTPTGIPYARSGSSGGIYTQLTDSSSLWDSSEAVRINEITSLTCEAKENGISVTIIFTYALTSSSSSTTATTTNRPVTVLASGEFTFG